MHERRVDGGAQRFAYPMITVSSGEAGSSHG